jgi:hypothetical protein
MVVLSIVRLTLVMLRVRVDVMQGSSNASSASLEGDLLRVAAQVSKHLRLASPILGGANIASSSLALIDISGASYGDIDE